MTYKFTPEIINYIAESLNKYKSEETLTKIYQWPIDNAIEKLALIDSNSYPLFEDQNLFQKTFLAKNIVRNKLLDKNLSDEIKNKLILWVIKDWGRIRIKPEHEQSTIKIVREKENNLSFDCNRIASWSKYFAFKYPEKYAIYDARVIYSLNWLLHKANSEFFFPNLNSENSLINAFDYKISILIKRKGISAVKNQILADIAKREENPQAKSRAITSLSKGLYINNKQAFLSYCHLLKCIASQLFDNNDTHALTKTEMILFAIADKDIVSDVLENQYALN